MTTRRYAVQHLRSTIGGGDYWHNVSTWSKLADAARAYATAERMNPDATLSLVDLVAYKVLRTNTSRHSV